MTARPLRLDRRASTRLIHWALAVAVACIARLVSKEQGSYAAGIGGIVAFFGALLITGIYKQHAVAFYPAQARVFMEMDEFIFSVILMLGLAWFAGILLQGLYQRRMAVNKKPAD